MNNLQITPTLAECSEYFLLRQPPQKPYLFLKMMLAVGTFKFERILFLLRLMRQYRIEDAEDNILWESEALLQKMAEESESMELMFSVIYDECKTFTYPCKIQRRLTRLVTDLSQLTKELFALYKTVLEHNEDFLMGPISNDSEISLGPKRKRKKFKAIIMPYQEN